MVSDVTLGKPLGFPVHLRQHLCYSHQEHTTTLAKEQDWNETCLHDFSLYKESFTIAHLHISTWREYYLGDQSILAPMALKENNDVI